jgi:hypothetical protein
MFKEVSNKPIDYVYWNDPNELVNRLRLLVAYQSADHTGHSNEIVSDIDDDKTSEWFHQSELRLKAI